MMEWLNNANVIAGLIVALFGIGGYIFAITTYLKGKATKSLQDNKSPVQTPSVRYPNTDNMTFDRIDWVNAFAKGFYYFSIGEVDKSGVADPLPMGCIFTPLFAGMASAVIGGVFFFIFNFMFNWSPDSAMRGAFVVGFICWLTILLGIYIHFVGEAIEAISNKKRKQDVLSIAAKKSPKVPLQKSPGVGTFTLALLSASLKIPRTSVLCNGVPPLSSTSHHIYC